MVRIKLMRKSIAILICIMIMFIASCGDGSTGPEYRYEDFYIQEIHDGYAYVVPEDQYGESDDPDIYAIDIDLFGSQVYESGSKVQVAYSDFDRDDLYGLNAHSVSVYAQ